jgi:hypothetical protein
VTTLQASLDEAGQKLSGVEEQLAASEGTADGYTQQCTALQASLDEVGQTLSGAEEQLAASEGTADGYGENTNAMLQTRQCREEI